MRKILEQKNSMALGWDQYSTNPPMEYLSNLQITPLTDGEKLYKVIQVHTPQADWKPADTPAHVGGETVRIEIK